MQVSRRSFAASVSAVQRLALFCGPSGRACEPPAPVNPVCQRVSLCDSRDPTPVCRRDAPDTRCSCLLWAWSPPRGAARLKRQPRGSRRRLGSEASFLLVPGEPSERFFWQPLSQRNSGVTQKRHTHRRSWAPTASRRAEGIPFGRRNCRHGSPSPLAPPKEAPGVCEYQRAAALRLVV